VQTWVLGSSGGDSAVVAGERGLPFAANYHVSPASVLDAVDAYRKSFRASATLAEPHVMVSADVVVGETDAAARELAAGYGPWVHSIRTGAGAIPFPDAAGAAAYPWSAEAAALVEDRVATQLTGSPATVVEKLAAPCAGDRGGRAAGHHDHPRPRGPGQLPVAARAGVVGGTAERLTRSSARS